jgi:hypothetical protein
MAGDEGFLPATVGATGPLRLPPEDVYSLVSQAAYIPSLRFVPGGPRAWSWSAARPLEIRVGGGTVTVDIEFPTGLSHYTLIHGLGNVTGLELRGIPWRPDPQYFLYGAGWYYEPETDGLFIKLTHQQATERVVIRFSE